jgi:Holliday junction resolvase
VFLQQKIGELLERTFIDPENLEKVYELFCLFTVVKTLEEQLGWEVIKLKEITKERNETAVLRKGQFQISIFYNVTGDLEFLDTTEPPEIKDALNLITKTYFGRQLQDTTRRPDIIIELASNGSVRDYILIEVKYTKEEDYVVSGLNQVLHYLYDLRNASGKFFASNLGRGYNAAVITYKLPESAEKTGKLDNQQLKVKLLDFDDLKNFESLKVFLERCLKNHNT